MSDERVYIGIDPTTGRGMLTFAVLNRQLEIMIISKGTPDRVANLVLGYSNAICAINSPSGPNEGLMAKIAYREKLGLNPKTRLYASYRVCEYELRRRGIGLYRAPRKPAKARPWMKLGWEVYDLLQKGGYVMHPQDGAQQLVETLSHASFAALLQKRPYRKTTLEGRLQRQLALFNEGLDIEDPMTFFEEWTRHRIVSGELVYDDLLEPIELDALVAAYTGLLLSEAPEHITLVGDADEGIIAVPAATLEDRYT